MWQGVQQETQSQQASSLRVPKGANVSLCDMPLSSQTKEFFGRSRQQQTSGVL